MKKVKGTKVALVSKFTLIIGVSVFITVLFISAYNLSAAAPILRQFKIDKNQQFSSISNILYSSANIDLNTGSDFSNSYKLAKNLVENNMVLYAALIDKNTKKYVWTTVDNIVGTKANMNNLWLDGGFSKKFTNLNFEDIQQNSYNLGNKMLVISFYNNSSIVNLIDLLIRGNLTLSLVFIIFGFCAAFILAKNVTGPIIKLVEGAEEFSQGNLKYRTDVKSDDEIGLLSKAFNDMADKLSDLYNSLEQKVLDRTHDLSKINIQLKRANKEIKDTQSMIVHNEKMRSLGQLVAGVAHELNNPINFIYGNLLHLKKYSNDFIEIINKYEAIQKQFPEDKFKEVEKLKQDLEYDFIVEDLELLLKSCYDGAERSKQIIIDLKNFSRLDEAQIKEVDIHEGIDSALNILESKYKGRVTINKQYGMIPNVMCYAGQINQVFMNILDNATQAIEGDGNIYIRTKIEDQNVIIEFEDTGAGIAEDVIPKIFDPFFTTKPVGEGTGLGLSICYKIIRSHNGKMEVESEKGKGTKFIIEIPINWTAQNEENSGKQTEVL
ncbi:MAG: ATP-binding protein [bacterium]